MSERFEKLQIEKKAQPKFNPPEIDVSIKEAEKAVYDLALTLMARHLGWDLTTTMVKARDQIARAGKRPQNVYAHAVIKVLKMDPLERQITPASQTPIRPNRIVNRAKI